MGSMPRPTATGVWPLPARRYRGSSRIRRLPCPHTADPDNARAATKPPMSWQDSSTWTSLPNTPPQQGARRTRPLHHHPVSTRYWVVTIRRRANGPSCHVGVSTCPPVAATTCLPARTASMRHAAHRRAPFRPTRAGHLRRQTHTIRACRAATEGIPGVGARRRKATKAAGSTRWQPKCWGPAVRDRGWICARVLPCDQGPHVRRDSHVVGRRAWENTDRIPHARACAVRRKVARRYLKVNGDLSRQGNHNCRAAVAAGMMGWIGALTRGIVDEGASDPQAAGRHGRDGVDQSLFTRPSPKASSWSDPT